jgi:N-dimethylarginine dimethylaminohydrolase
MCAPEHFAVSYAINPWMDPQGWAREGRALAARSRGEWSALHQALSEAGAMIDLVPSVPGLPDLVFTANAAVVLDGKVLLARFRHPERRREEPYFAAAFRELQNRGLVEVIEDMPDGLVLEGAGDCVFDATRNLFWMGHGQRSDVEARSAVEDAFGVETLTLELADPRFYHMDTALCPLTGGEVMYVPGAFTSEGLAAIRAQVEPADRIEIVPDDAEQLAANAVCVGDTIVLSRCGEAMRRELEERDYRVLTRPLDSFRRSGGSAFCLTLRLDRRSAAARRAVDAGRITTHAAPVA